MKHTAQILKRTMVEKSPEQKAREAADFISKIKEDRFNLLTGYQEVSYNQETLEYMDTQLKLLEKEYMKLFTGIFTGTGNQRSQRPA